MAGMAFGRTIVSERAVARRGRTVVYTGGFELPDQNAAAHRVRGNARIFRDLGFRVVLLGVSHAARPGASVESVDSGEEGIEAWEVPYPAGSRAWLDRTISPRSFAKVLDLAKVEDLALTICYNYPAVAQWRIARLARQRGACAIADVTEWYDRVRLDGLAALVKNLDTPLRMHWINRRMDGLITASPFITGFYRSTGLPIVELPTIIPGRVKQTPPPARAQNGVRRLFFAGTGFEPSEALRGRAGLKDRVDWVLEVLAQAKRLGSRFHLDLFGVERENYLTLVPEHRQLLAELDGELTFHGRQPHAQILEKLRTADFSIFLRKRTRVTLAGFPSKFSESVTYGTPVITNPMPSTSRYLREGENGFLIDPDSPQRAAEKLNAILVLPVEAIDTMKARCAASGQFTPRAFIGDVDRWLASMGGVS